MLNQRGSVLTQALILTVIALVLGAVVHTFRSSATKIEWLKDYPDATTPPKVKEAPPSQSPTPAQPPPVAAQPKPAQPAPAPSPAKSPENPPAASPTPTPAPAPAPVAAKEGVREITVEEAIEEHKNGTPFLDARRTKDYDKGHVPGAISMSVWEPNLDGRISELLGKVDASMTVVIYCTGGDCTDSHQLATSLQGAGYKDLLIMKGGVPDWVKLGGPAAEKTPGADSSEEGE